MQGDKGTPMVSMVSPRHDEHPDDLLVVDSPSLRGRLSESAFPDNPLLGAKPSFGKRASRTLIRYLIACGVGVGGTLAWQSYGDAAKQTVAAWGAERGWPMTWLSNGDAVNASPPRPERTEAVPTAQKVAEIGPGPAGGSSSDLEQLKTMTLGMAATLTTMREKIEQLAAGQQQTASDIAKLQAAEQEIRHKISAAATRPAVAAPSKPAPIAPPRALAPPR
jgi:hypothetical protein